MADVVTMAEYFRTRHTGGDGLSVRDRAELGRWAARDRRLIFCPTETGEFSLIYNGPQPWASWGVTRQDGQIVVWDCITFADLCQAPTVTRALRAVEGGPVGPTGTVFRFDAASRYA